MSKPSTDYASELYDAVKLFIDQPLNNPLTRSQIMDVARIALPILEQQERGEGEWIEWRGGECPVSADTLVDCKRADGDEYAEYPAGSVYWYDSGCGDSIIAYRVVKS